MAEGKATYQTMYKMKQLPKAEYQLSRALIEQYGLDDPRELHTVLLRLAWEVLHFGSAGEGEQWLINVIQQWRDNPGEQRTYELSLPRKQG